MRFVVSFSILVLSSVIFAAEPRIHRDIAYFEPKEQRRSLDVYTTTESKNQPIVFWIHGGGWQRGDKSDVAAKPWAFLDRGFVFVSTNYRFVPNVTIKQIAEDLAKALQDAGVQARVYAARRKNHTTLNSDLGLPGDEATKLIFRRRLACRRAQNR